MCINVTRYGCDLVYICSNLLDLLTMVDLFSERARLAPPWPLTSSHLFTASFLLLAGPFLLFFAFYTIFFFLPFHHFFHFLFSSFFVVPFLFIAYVKPTNN